MEQEEQEEQRVEVVVKRQEATKVDQQPPQASDRNNKPTGKYLAGPANQPTPILFYANQPGSKY
jgi:hypothetical protein